MNTTIEQLETWMNSPEAERLEFKEAKKTYGIDDLAAYCVALANERGGKMIFGVTNQRPRKIVGSAAFTDVQKATFDLYSRLHLRVELEELATPSGRVLIAHIPSRPTGTPLEYKGAYLMRSGESLVSMTPDQLRRIMDESGPDFSAELVPSAAIEDLDPDAIDAFRALWVRTSENMRLQALDDEALLTDAELLVDGKLTYAALILMGSSKALGRHLASAELVYEYRTKDSSIPAQKRINFRDAFLKFYDAIWNEIELRNEIHPYQIGARILIIPTFNERVVREALLNAVTHRDYRLSGSVFVKQYPTRLMVESPGGFLPGITKENVLSRHQPRNRRLAETLARLGFVERSGQGIDLMFEKSIREGKATPDFSGTDDYQVLVTLNGEIKNPRFVTFLEQVGKEKGIEFTVEDLIVLDHIFRDQPIPDKLLSRLKGLEEEGLIERHRKHYVLARRFYGMIGKKGVYTRKVGLDRDAQEQLLEKHIRENDMDGSTMTELMQVLHNLSRAQVSAIIKRLARADRIHVRGVTKNARWYYGPKPESESL